MAEGHGLRHAALADAAGERWRAGLSWREAAPGDQAKLGLLLELAGVVSACGAARLAFGRGDDLLEGTRIDGRGRLLVAGLRPGGFPAAPQTLLGHALLKAFGGRDGIQGRGAPRKAARLLRERWRQELVPSPAEQVVADLFGAAPSLWTPSAAEARTALYAELPGPAGWRPRLALPAAPRRRLLRAARGGLDPRELLRSAEAARLWLGAEAGDAGPASARRAFERGDYPAALQLLGRRDDTDALLLRLACQHAQHEHHAAFKTLHRLAGRPFDAEQMLTYAELSNRLAGGRLDRAAIRRQTEVLRERLADAGEELHARAALVAAGGAWDLGDNAAMAAELARAARVAAHPLWGWRWHLLSGQQALAAGDALAAAAALAKALGWRRRLPLADAGRIWIELGVARAALGDLAAAERACRHAWRLLRRCEGPASTTLALANLAEVRLRRGVFAGVAGTLERSIAENRAAANSRALAHDLALAARYELARGRPQAALARCAEAAALEAPGLGPTLAALACRAHGWLGQTERAAAILEGPVALAELELEERAALFALAGLAERARQEAHATPFQPLWSAVLGGLPPAPEAWLALDLLEPYRAARLLHDLEKALPACAPDERRRWAARALRAAAAEGLADALEAPGLPLARALRAYAGQPAGDPAAAAALLRDAGYPDAARLWSGGGEKPPDAVGDPVGDPGGDDPLLDALQALLRRDLAAAAPAPRPLESLGPSPGLADGIVGRSPALRLALDRLDRLAGGQWPIYVQGETGSGKEAIARRCHRASPRRNGPFLAINCAALGESLILSDLFGHVRGAFTGADRDRAGIFEAARGGTVFLDEIGDLPFSCQGHLLRVLQESEIRRVGESICRKVDVRVVAASHRDLEELVAAGRFREDLCFRLKAAKIRVPPLRERGDDILLLAEHFLDGARHGKTPRLGAAAKKALREYAWPGNIRELKNVLEVAAALADGEEITTRELELPTKFAPEAADLAENHGESALENVDEKGSFHQQLDDLRIRLLKEAVEKSGGNRAKAARLLGLTRQALSYHARQLGLF